MCPSFMVTREEEHSTRGRARLLFEMFEGEGHPGELEQRGGEGVARPLPGVQRLQRRLPGQRRHGHVQGGVPVALLRAARCGRSPRTRWAGSTGGRGWPRSRRGGERDDVAADRQDARRRGAAARDAARSRQRDVPARAFPHHATARRGTPTEARPALAGHVQQPLPSRHRASRPPRCSKPPAIEVDHPAQAALLRTPALRLGLPRHGEESAARDARRARSRSSTKACRSSASSRAASSVFRDELPNLFPDDERREAACAADLDAQRVSGAARTSPLPRLERQGARAGALPSQAMHALRRRRERAASDSASTSSIPTPAAAAWPAPSASRQTTTTSRCASASACCCRRARGRARHAHHR